MKFVHHFYVIIIILRSAWVVQNVADFTLDELKKISLKLNPVECMRLIEAIYLAIPVIKENRTDRDTPVNNWVSKHACLDELRAWNSEYPDNSEPKARVVMFLHLTALGRSDLASYVGKNRRTRSTFGKVDKQKKVEKNDHKKTGIVKHKTNKKKTDHHPHTKKINHRVQHRLSNQYNIHQPMVATVAREPLTHEDTAATGKNQPGRWDQAASRNSLFLMIALVLVLLFICVIIYLIVRRSLGNCMCCCKRSDSHPGNNSTREKALQCVCLNDDRDSFDDFEAQSNQAFPASEIDVEGGSGSVHSVNFEDRKSYSDTMLGHGMNTSVERLNLFDEESAILIVEEPQPLSSCRCRPLEPNICCTKPKKPKKSKKKCKDKCKGETKTAKSYLKAVHDKILPRQRSKVKKDSTFDMKQFQEKILAVLNQECGACQCCNCSLRLGGGGSKLDEKRPKHEKKEHREKQKGEKSSNANEVPSYQTSVASRSPVSAKRSHRNQESDSGKKCVIRNVDKAARKCASAKTKRGKYRKVIVSSSSSSEIEIYNHKDSEKRRKFKSKRSKHGEAR